MGARAQFALVVAVGAILLLSAWRETAREERNQVPTVTVLAVADGLPPDVLYDAFLDRFRELLAAWQQEGKLETQMLLPGKRLLVERKVTLGASTPDIVVRAEAGGDSFLVAAVLPRDQGNPRTAAWLAARKTLEVLRYYERERSRREGKEKPK